MKSLVVKNRSIIFVLTLFLSFHTFENAQAAQIDEKIRINWGIFSERCGRFLANPKEFFSHPEKQKINDWGWGVRSSDDLEYFEYLAVSSDDTTIFGAAWHKDASSNGLSCSLQISAEVPAGGSEVLRQSLQSYFSSLEHIDRKIGVFRFSGSPTNVARMKNYYSTQFSMKLINVPNFGKMPVFVSTGDRGNIYFETNLPQN